MRHLWLAALLLAACSRPAPPAPPVRTLIAVFDRGKWGYIDRAGAMRIAPAYEYAGEFCEGLAAVDIDGSLGFIDESGKLVIPARFNRTGDFRDGRAPATLDGRDGVVDRNGDFKSCTPDELRKLPRSAPVDPWHRNLSDGRALFAAPDGRFGYVDVSGTVAIQPRFELASAFRDGVAHVVIDALWMCIDTSGRTLWRPEFPLAGAALEWSFDKDRASLGECVRRASGPFTVEVARPDPKQDALRISFRAASDVLYGWHGHSQSAFEVVDGVLYHTDFSQDAYGCRVVAFDLRNRKRLWMTQLYAAGASTQLKAPNAVDLALRDGRVIVSGNDWRKYVEVLDATTGRILGHRLVK